MIPDNPDRETRLMTFNIAHGRGLSFYQGFHRSAAIRKNLDRIARIINEYSPDVVALQEVDQSSHWNKHIDLLAYLQEATQYPFSEHGIHNRRSGRKPLAYGNAFLSKHPILNTEVISFGDKTIGEKGFMEIHVDIAGRTMDFINLHLDFRSRKTRMIQIERVLEKIERRSHHEPERLPPIICGDFNTSSRKFADALQQFVVRSARHHSYTYHPRDGRTFPAHFPSRGLDFALVAQPYKVIGTQIVQSFASDHLPAIVDFTLPSIINGTSPHPASAETEQ